MSLVTPWPEPESNRTGGAFKRLDETASAVEHARAKPRVTMRPDQTTRTDPSPESPPTKPRLDLSLSKILGGALAAMTAAALGSRLSVGGTIAGAALASIIAAVAGTIYTTSLKHTQDRVKTVFSGRTVQGGVVTVVEEVAESESPTRVLDAPAQPSVPHWDDPLPAAQKPSRAPVNWKSIVIGALAAFALAAAALTTIELVTGRALSGGDGTTISQVGEQQRNAPSTDPSAPAETASPTPEPTPSASTSASTAPTPSASATEPTPQPSATEPTASTTTSSAPSPTPSASGSARAPEGDVTSGGDAAAPVN